MASAWLCGSLSYIGIYFAVNLEVRYLRLSQRCLALLAQLLGTTLLPSQTKNKVRKRSALLAVPHSQDRLVFEFSLEPSAIRAAIGVVSLPANFVPWNACVVCDTVCYAFLVLR